MSIAIDLSCQIGGVAAGGSLGAALVLSLAAHDIDNVQQLQVIGTGTPTQSHTATIYAQDADGVYTSFGANKAVWEGGRYSDEDTVYSTDSGGAALDPQPWLKYQPAGTAYWQAGSERDSRDLTAWSKIRGVAAYNQVGITGAANSASLFSDDGSGGTDTVYFDVTIGGLTSGAPNTACVICKKGTLSWVRIHMVSYDTGPYAYFDLDNVLIGNTSGSPDDVEIVDLGNGYVACYIQFTTVTDLVGIFRIFLADGDNDSNITLNGTNNLIFGNINFHKDKALAQVRDLGPIFTTTAVASTDATPIDFDEDINDTEGALYCEIEFSFDDAEVSGNHEILSTTTGASLLYYDADNQQIESTDGTNTAVKALTVAKNTTYKLGLIWDAASGLRVCVDGEWGTAESYDGSFTGTSLLAFRNLDYCAKIRNVKVWDKGGTLGKSAVDAAMGA